MAGKRMRLSTDMKLFSHNPVDRKTINGWKDSFNHAALVPAVKQALAKATFKTVWIQFDDVRQVSSYLELAHSANVGPCLTRTSVGNLLFSDATMTQIMNATFIEANEATEESGLWLLMLLNTWRAVEQNMTGPMPGFSFNITIAGIMATAMKLGVDVDFESRE